jgi:hypothetical protein
MNPKWDMEGASGCWRLLERSRISTDSQKTSQLCDIVKIGVRWKGQGFQLILKKHHNHVTL